MSEQKKAASNGNGQPAYQGNSILPIIDPEQYHKMGFSIFPLWAKSKTPTGKWKQYQERHPSYQEIKLWKEQHPNGNWAIVTGAISGVVVLDIDDVIGFKKANVQIPHTPTVSTGKGYHLYFRHPGYPISNNARKIEEWCDIRGDGGYVVAPPSIHPNGKVYEWERGKSPWECDFAEMPQWLIDKIQAENSEPAPTHAAHSKISDNEWAQLLNTGAIEGSRNDTAARLAGYLFGKGLPHDVVSTMLTDWNQKNSPPLSNKELMTVINSISGREARKPDTQKVSAYKPSAAEDFGESRTLNLYTEWERELAKTGKYAVKNGNLCSIKYNKNGETEVIPLANFLARPVREVVEDNGVETNWTFEIEGILAGGKPLPKVVIPSEKFASMAWVAAEWGMKANVEPGSVAKDKVRHAIQTLAQDIEREHVFTHLGWRKIDDEWIYLHSKGSIGGEGYRVNLERENMQKYALPEKTEDLQNALKMSLDTLNLADRSTTIPLLSMIGLAPLCEAFRQAGIEPAFVLWVVGESGSRKSTLVALYLNHFGIFPDGKSLPSSFKDTSNSIEKKAFLTKDSLLVIDDYHPSSTPIEAKKMEQLAQEVLRGYGDRIGKTRMRPDGTLRPSYPPRGIAIVTAEDKPTAGTSTTARYFPVEMDRKSVNLTLLTQLQRNQDKLSHAMRGYIEWLKPKMEDLPGTLKEMFLSVRDGQMDKERHGRINDSVSWLYIGLQVFTNFAVESGVITEMQQRILLQEAYEIFNDISEKQASFMHEDKPSELFISGLRELLDTNMVYVNDVLDQDARGEGKFIGYCDHEFLYLHNKTSYEEVKKFYERQGLNFPVTANTLLKHLENENMILVKKLKNKTERTLVKKIGGKNAKFIWVHKNALELNEDE